MTNAAKRNAYLFSKLSLIVAVCCLFIDCSGEKPSEESVIVVKVPPFYDDKLSRQENFWRFQHFLFPQKEIPNPIPKGLPNDDSILFVSINEDGKIKLNSEDEGDVSETEVLRERLTAIFQGREKDGVYETGTRNVVKAVGVQTAPSIKYGDFIKVVDAVKQSGAEPTVLLFDDDARPKLTIDTRIRK